MPVYVYECACTARYRPVFNETPNIKTIIINYVVESIRHKIIYRYAELQFNYGR